MACAALKRPHNFDLLAGTTGSPKRRRCGAMVTSTPPSSSPCSSFLEATPKYCRDDLTRSVYDEWKRMQRRKKLACPASPPNNTSNFQSSPMQSSFWSSSLGSPSRVSMLNNGSMSPPRGKEQPSLPLKQVVSLCERLWKEREDKLREEYDQVLNERLAEQYDSFLKFTQDQIMRKYQQSSCSWFVPTGEIEDEEKGFFD